MWRSASLDGKKGSANGHIQYCVLDAHLGRLAQRQIPIALSFCGCRISKPETRMDKIGPGRCILIFDLLSPRKLTSFSHMEMVISGCANRCEK